MSSEEINSDSHEHWPSAFIAVGAWLVGLMMLVVGILFAMLQLDWMVQHALGAESRSVQATLYCATWCKPCASVAAELRDRLPKRGLKIGEDNEETSDHVLVKKFEKDLPDDLKLRSIPCLIIRKDGKEVTRIYGKKHLSPDDVVKAIEKVEKQ